VQLKSYKPKFCPITQDTHSKLKFSYVSPPDGETHFKIATGESYFREVWEFQPCGHFISIHSMQINTNYDGAYVEATYKNAKELKKTYEKIISLPQEASDNAGRFKAVKTFADSFWENSKIPNLLDIGSGLGVFPNTVKSAGWSCTSIDPDPIAVEHIKAQLKINVLHGDFMELNPSNQFDIITLNKVLEHVKDPVSMLARAKQWIDQAGFIYLEVPDGELACNDGSSREEFFVDHLHIFSLASVAIMAKRAGFVVRQISRLQEPSSKYTIRAFLSIA
jgi:2-polyprenyl-3-methyl-5-hydroxy-6-metoxy-1,4-benzoquinol methylase